ncbi:hypothetical protein [Streptomyces gilvifuscus]|uniref:Uncharacterized protein n=1 Tax=Streptomyces gilvifuscus TaxID=1550617 RepID=A0ABT5G340_9ACTN|nr:hypothetical protein [Streptomyces gilvifuscus]MDC2959272.1 hypothetical protein [Streptomyces gilvifuscus]
MAGSSGTGVGVSGESQGDNGVLGTTEDGTKAGVFGHCTAGENGIGVTGLADGYGGAGVFGTAQKRDGTGVVGVGATGMQAEGGAGPGLVASSKQNHGVVGSTEEGGGVGVFGQGGKVGTGVLGTTSAASQPAVQGRHEGGGTGVLGATDGSADNLTDPVAAVKGTSTADAPAVLGISALGAGIVGHQGKAYGFGVAAGVVGASVGDTGVYGVGPTGVKGVAVGADATAVLAFGGLQSLGNPQAGSFAGPVDVLGSLQVVGGPKLFVIDHPSDPERRYLQHAAVEAPALKTFYDGTVTLDGDGTARVELPPWFGLLNTDLCYSLTPVGAPAPELHVSQQYDGTAFTVAGGRAGARVCWQVTGVRRDPSALAHPLVVERDKEPENLGRYADPQAYGRPRSDLLAWAAKLSAEAEELARGLGTASAGQHPQPS